MDLCKEMAKKFSFARNGAAHVQKAYSQVMLEILWNWKKDFLKIEAAIYGKGVC